MNESILITTYLWSRAIKRGKNQLHLFVQGCCFCFKTINMLEISMQISIPVCIHLVKFNFVLPHSNKQEAMVHPIVTLQLVLVSL